MKKIFIILSFIVLASPAFCQEYKSLPLIIDEVTFVRADVETAPSFPGGHNAWFNFLQNNLQVNVGAANHAPAGTYYIVLNFVVDITGRVINATALTRYGYGLEKEAIRLIKLTRWRPATIKDKPVNAEKKQIITFKVNSLPTSI